MSNYDEKAPRFKAWQTPPEFFKKLDEEFHFTLDAAASHQNALCDFYYTTDGRWQKGEDWPLVVIGAGDGRSRNGLTGDWTGERVWLNPPYDSSISQWVDKAFKFEAEVAMLLLPPSFDTAWGQRIWEAGQDGYAIHYYTLHENGRYLWMPQSVEIRLPPGRLRFLRPAFKDRLPNGKKHTFTLKDYALLGEEIFDYSKPSVAGEAPRAGNLVAIFRK